MNVDARRKVHPTDVEVLCVAPKVTAPFVFSPPMRIVKPAEAACWGEKPAPTTPNYTGPESPDPLPFQVTALAWPERSLGPTLVHTPGSVSAFCTFNEKYITQ
ncbi:hypothetical protein M0804_001621 [Polistes exclamans]|nr:hypothetical protein M0804_001621 [Polistes exclamans]